jgi:4-diphosphocytidyl-2-C-methyl-D-erythritol kinase
MDLPASTLSRHAAAKINLALHVTGRRPDGYHLLESLAVFTRFGDRITVSRADEDCFSVSGPFAAGVPIDNSNLVLRARDALRGAFPGRDCPPVAITLEKNLPVASGVGGGSSDAAATVRALASFWGIDDNAASSVGPALGADLPMCLAARPLIARGIGEILAPLPRFPALPLVLVNPGAALSTPKIFRLLASRENPGLPPLSGEPDFASVAGWLAAARNDLEAPAISAAPVIGNALEALNANGAAVARMSGSGATCFGLFETWHQALDAAKKIAGAHPDWWIVATESMAAGEAIDGEA